MRPRTRAGFALASLVGVVFLSAGPAVAQVAVDPTVVDFGAVLVGQQVDPRTVTVTNTGAGSFGPLNMFGGAPLTPEFGASQSCQGRTLAPGESCQISYTFMPSGEGQFSDNSRFIISPTTSQGDGQDFVVELRGAGMSSTTTSTSTTTTDTLAPTTTTVPQETTSSAPATTAPGGAPGTSPLAVGGPGSPGGGAAMPGDDRTPSGDVPAEDTAEGAFGTLAVTLARVAVPLGQAQTATVEGFQPGERVTAVVQPINVDLGSQVAGDDGEVQFAWTVPTTNLIGEHELVATGEVSGEVSAAFAVVATPEDAVAASASDSGWSPLLVVLVVVAALAGVAGGATVTRRRGRGADDRVAATADTAELPEV